MEPPDCRICHKPRSTQEATAFGSICGDCWADCASHGQQHDERILSRRPWPQRHGQKKPKPKEVAT